DAANCVLGNAADCADLAKFGGCIKEANCCESSDASSEISSMTSWRKRLNELYAAADLAGLSCEPSGECPIECPVFNVRAALERSGTADPAEAVKNSGLGRLSAPRSDGLGAEQPSAPHLPEERAAEDADFVDEGPGEALAVDALAPAAAMLHKNVLVEGFDEPLPLEALDPQDSLDKLPHVAGGHSRPLKPPYEHIRRAPPGLLQRLAEVEKLEGKSKGSKRTKRRGQFEFDDDVPVRVRVLDVDALALEELHKAFMYTLVRRRPAEVCVRVASRLAVFRDKPGQQSYQNLLQDCGRLFGSLHGPELLALFARCFSTISVPFMLDYTRKYGHFSRGFLAEQVEKSLRPGFFDFLRYEENGGVRPLPLIVAKPWSLGSYTRLMTKSYLKSRMHEQLKLHGHVPNVEQDTDPDMPPEARVIEHLGRAGSLRVEAPKGPSPEVQRPALLEAIVQAAVVWTSQIVCACANSPTLLKMSHSEAKRWVIVQPQWGLCNRLRAVASGRMLAEHLSRSFLVDWQPLPGCNCAWDRLFSSESKTLSEELQEDPDPSVLAAAELLHAWDEVVVLARCKPDSQELRGAMRSFEAFHRECYRAGLAYLLDAASEKWRSCRPFHGRDSLPSFLEVDCLCVRAFNPFYPPREEDRQQLAAERAAHLNCLVAAAPVRQRLWQLPEGTISVHIRRTDHAKAIARSPEDLFVQAMDSYGTEAKFFLATDDAEVESRLRRRYGQRLLTQPKRTLSRNDPDGIEDALLDLLMLSQGSEVLGSYKSSFSAMASHFRCIPLHVVDVRPESAPDPAARVGAGFREVSVVAADPEDDCPGDRRVGKVRQCAEYSGVGWDASQADGSTTKEKPRPFMRGARRAMAEAELHDSDGEGYSDFYDSDDEEAVSDDEGGTSGGKKFGLQFERVVPDSAYSAIAEDGALVDAEKLQKDSATASTELEEAFADRWWSQFRRHFFRHNYGAYRLLDGRWQRVPDPNGPRYKPRQRKRVSLPSIINVANANVMRDTSQMMSDNDCQSEEFLWSLGVGASLPSWLQEMRHEQRQRGLNQGPHVDTHSKERLGVGPQVGSSRPHAAPRRATADGAKNTEVEINDQSVAEALASPRRVCMALESCSLKDWLISLDDSGFLVQYHDSIASKLDSVAQIVETYAKDSGEVDPQFFDDAGITKLGHRRLFQKWFRENCFVGGLWVARYKAGSAKLAR
ncbi:unnamed protein product, partial [Symbiodinium microadriaticum]